MAELAIQFLTGAFTYCPEFINMGKALDGAMKVRKGPNQKGNLQWFHAFVLSVVTAFAGGLLNNIWLGQPSGLLANDLAFGCCIITYVLINCVPNDLGFKLCNSMPFALLTLVSSQLFQSLGLIKFLKAGFVTFPASKYYDIPVFGPIIFATLLGNMGPLLLKGLEPHVRDGMAWNVQAGLFGATFYLFYALDTKGPIGEMLRVVFPAASVLGLDNENFACAFVSWFFQIMGLLQMPQLLGPNFTPFSLKGLSSLFMLTDFSAPVKQVEKPQPAGIKEQEAKKDDKAKKAD